MSQTDRQKGIQEEDSLSLSARNNRGGEWFMTAPEFTVARTGEENQGFQMDHEMKQTSIHSVTRHGFR